MAMEILKSFNHLQSELEEAKNSLKGVDENIKRLIGRDPSDIPPRTGQKRPLDDKNSRQQFSKFNRGLENEDIPKRRNPNAVSVFKRLSDKVPDEPVRTSSKGLISKVIAAPKEIPSRQDVLDKQNKDEKFKARNRRMFGALLGTLQRFQQEESKQKRKEEKRTQIEKKIEEHEQQEKEEIKKERQELFLNRKKKQQEIKMIELKMLRMKEYAAWEETQKPRANYIITKAKPHIHYLPRRLNDKSKELLEESKKDIEEQIEKRRQEVNVELNHIEERMKRNFENKNNIENNKVEEIEKSNNEKHDRHNSDRDSEFEDDGDIKMRTLSPEPKEEQDENNKVEENIQEETEINKDTEVDNSESQEINSQNNISDHLDNKDNENNSEIVSNDISEEQQEVKQDM